MNTEDEIKLKGRNGWNTFDIVYSVAAREKGMNAWSIWRHHGSIDKWVATAYTRNEVIEKAKIALDQ